MKKSARTLVISLIAFIIFAYFYPGFDYGGEVGVLLLAALIFTVLNVLVRPIINILSLPFNLLTFGLFNAIINVAIFFVINYFLPAFKIVPYHFPGSVYSGFIIPAADVTLIFSALVASVVISLISTILLWIFR